MLKAQEHLLPEVPDLLQPPRVAGTDVQDAVHELDGCRAREGRADGELPREARPGG